MACYTLVAFVAMACGCPADANHRRCMHGNARQCSPPAPSRCRMSRSSAIMWGCAAPARRRAQAGSGHAQRQQVYASAWIAQERAACACRLRHPRLCSCWRTRRQHVHAYSPAAWRGPTCHHAPPHHFKWVRGCGAQHACRQPRGCQPSGPSGGRGGALVLLGKPRSLPNAQRKPSLTAGTCTLQAAAWEATQAAAHLRRPQTERRPVHQCLSCLRSTGEGQRSSAACSSPARRHEAHRSC